jgi:hypothetical protein
MRSVTSSTQKSGRIVKRPKSLPALFFLTLTGAGLFRVDCILSRDGAIRTIGTLDTLTGRQRKILGNRLKTFIQRFMESEGLCAQPTNKRGGKH